MPALAGHRFNLAGTRALRRQAGTAGVVVAHGSSTLLACGLGLVGLGVPFVYLSIGDPRYWAKTAARRRRTRWLLKRAAAIVAISPTAREVLVGYYGLDVDRVHVIPNGRSGARFRPADIASREAARRELGLLLRAEVVAFVGALGLEKRVDLTIEAVARLPETMLVVAGDGPERRVVETLATRVAPRRVVFIGATEGPDAVLMAADVLALSSDSEGVSWRSYRGWAVRTASRSHRRRMGT